MGHVYHGRAGDDLCRVALLHEHRAKLRLVGAYSGRIPKGRRLWLFRDPYGHLRLPQAGLGCGAAPGRADRRASEADRPGSGGSSEGRLCCRRDLQRRQQLADGGGSRNEAGRSLHRGLAAERPLLRSVYADPGGAAVLRKAGGACGLSASVPAGGHGRCGTGVPPVLGRDLRSRRHTAGAGRK